MKLECSRDKLKQAVTTLERLTGKNLSLPILARLFLSAKGHNLIVRATNLDLGAEWRLPAKVIESGEITVSGAVLANLFSNLSTVDKITLEVINGNLTVAVANSSTLVKVYPSEDFPTLPEIDQTEEFSLDSQDFIQGVKAVAYAAALNDIKPEIASVFIFNDSGSGELYFVATDSFRLAEKKIVLNNSSNLKKLKADLKLIIPIRNIGEIARLLENVSGLVTWQYNRNQLNIFNDQLTVTSRLIDGIFPDYRQIIPTKSQSQVSLEKVELLNALKLNQIFTDRLNHITLKLRPGEKALELTSQNGEVGENTSLLPADPSGEELAINFNLRYLLDGLQAIGDEKISLQFNGRNKPIMLSGINDASFRYLIMPLNR